MISNRFRKKQERRNVWYNYFLSARCRIWSHDNGLYISISLRIHSHTITPWWCHQMETFSALLAFVRGIHRSPASDASDAELWCFLWSAPEQTVAQTLDTLVIWGAIALIITSLNGWAQMWIGEGVIPTISNYQVLVQCRLKCVNKGVHLMNV